MSEPQILKIKYVADSIFRGDAPTYVDDDGIRVVNQACVQEGRLDLSRVKFHDSSDSKRLKGWLKHGDVLINSTGTGTLGRVAYYDGHDEQIIFDGHVTVVRDNEGRFEPRFLAHALSIKQEELTVFCSDGSTNQIELSRAKLGAYMLMFPPLAEQQAIAAMLDRETAQLDALLAEKRRLLELLAEKRYAFITRAVTRGVVPNARLRDSDLSWLGEIPEHWREMHLKRALTRIDYGISESVSDEGNVAVLRMGDIQNGEVVFDNIGFVNDVDEELLLEPDDLLFNRTNSLDQIGKVGVFRGHTQHPVTFASYLVRMRCASFVLPYFLNFLLNAPFVMGWSRSEALPSIGQANLNPNRYGYLPIALPPLDEQRAIVAHIEAETRKLDDLRAAAERSINLLKERRAALIAAAVTGRLAVAP